MHTSRNSFVPAEPQKRYDYRSTQQLTTELLLYLFGYGRKPGKRALPTTRKIPLWRRKSSRHWWCIVKGVLLRPNEYVGQTFSWKRFGCRWRRAGRGEIILGKTESCDLWMCQSFESPSFGRWTRTDTTANAVLVKLALLERHLPLRTVHTFRYGFKLYLYCIVS